MADNKNNPNQLNDFASQMAANQSLGMNLPKPSHPEEQNEEIKKKNDRRKAPSTGVSTEHLIASAPGAAALTSLNNGKNSANSIPQTTPGNVLPGKSNFVPGASSVSIQSSGIDSGRVQASGAGQFDRNSRATVSSSQHVPKFAQEKPAFTHVSAYSRATDQTGSKAAAAKTGTVLPPGITNLVQNQSLSNPLDRVEEPSRDIQQPYRHSSPSEHSSGIVPAMGQEMFLSGEQKSRTLDRPKAFAQESLPLENSRIDYREVKAESAHTTVQESKSVSNRSAVATENAKTDSKAIAKDKLTESAHAEVVKDGVQKPVAVASKSASSTQNIEKKIQQVESRAYMTAKGVVDAAVRATGNEEDKAQKTATQYMRSLGLTAISAKNFAETALVKKDYYLNKDQAKAVRNALENNPTSSRAAKSLAVDDRGMFNNVREDIKSESAALNSYLKSYGLNPDSLSKREIKNMLNSDATLKNIAGTHKDELRAVLQEKLRVDKIQARGLPGSGVRYASDASKAIFGAFMSGGSEEMESGYKSYQDTKFMIGKGAWVAKGVLTGTAQIVNKGAEYTTRAAAGTTKIFADKKVKALSKKGLEGTSKAKAYAQLSEKASATGKFAKKVGSKVTAVNKWVLNTNASDKAKAVAGKGASLALKGAKKTAEKAKNKLAKTAVGRFSSAMKRGVGKILAPVQKIKSGIGKILSAPIRAFQGLRRIRKIMVALAIAGPGKILFLIIPVIPAVCLVALFPAGADANTRNEAGDTMVTLAIQNMQQMYSEYLHTIEAYCNQHYNPQTRYDEDGNPYQVTVSYSAFYSQTIKGDKTDMYEELDASSGPSSLWKSDIANETESGNPFENLRTYDLVDLYKAVLFVNHVKVENNPYDQATFVQYCKETFQEVLDSIKYYKSKDEAGNMVPWTWNSETNSIEEPEAEVHIMSDMVSVDFNQAGLTNVIRADLNLDPNSGHYIDWRLEDDCFGWAQLMYEMEDGRVSAEDDDLKLLGFDFSIITNPTVVGDSTLEAGSGITYGSLDEESIRIILENAGVMEGSRIYELLKYALAQVGCEYNQENRFGVNPNVFDCSSLAYRAYSHIGENISYGGGTTAAAEEEGLERQGKMVTVSGTDQLMPGDLVFTCDSSCANGRHRGITHVVIYVGNGQVVEAKGRAYGVVYGPLRISSNKYYVACRVL